MSMSRSNWNAHEACLSWRVAIATNEAGVLALRLLASEAALPFCGGLDHTIFTFRGRPVTSETIVWISDRC